MDNLTTQLLAGNRRALARLLSQIENQVETAAEALAQLHPHTGRAWIIGVTGAPGTGKSSLVNALAQGFRQRGQTVAILAVDPTSPFSGGAILGDRIRMRDLSGDSGVFIRSMATRGSLGGLARATRDCVRLMDAAGFDVILVETVGAGQSEIDIVRTAYTTIVVEAPGLGDDVQAIKAGILEIADVLVVNKADRPGAQQTVRALRAMLELGHPVARQVSHHGQLMTVGEAPVSSALQVEDWSPIVVETVATEKKGIDALLEAIDAHRAHLQGEAFVKRQRQNIEVELLDRLQTALLERLNRSLSSEALRDMIDQVRQRQLSPQAAVGMLLSRL
ncbi:MAG: methylmalonyl Co-A mutase-associated GTPase MeaB [Anaerolineae bacterium]|nr:methylmalonyl Co-A mutase-associated GTPase MeaB [Anaerolineae bacterium]MDW8172876.1 methylmalonyl Co-A mutase-associated GTPase MeaB [Anaerolineae bacterium]